MAKKYLNQDEAAARIGISLEELRSLRESGEIRGFADRGAWKYKEEDVRELARSRQLGSDPDIPLITDVDSSVDGLDEDEVGSRKTVIRQGGRDDETLMTEATPSDSDVRLIHDDTPDDDFASIPPVDSDVRLESGANDEAGDSDVRVVDGGTDSDVRMVGGELAGTDSDVRHVGAGSDSDVKLVDTDSDVVLASGSGLLDSDAEVPIFTGSGVIGGDSDSDVNLVGDSDVEPEPSDDPENDSDSDVVLAGDSDADLRDDEDDSDSDVVLAGESATNLLDSDSDVRLVPASTSDSDVKLVDAPADEGRPGSDSDVRLIGSGALEGSDSDVRLLDTDSGVDPAGSGSDSDVAIIAADGSGLLFDDDDDESSIFSQSDPLLDDPGATLAGASGIFSPTDSGINLETRSSGVVFEESGIQLDAGSDIGLVDDAGSAIGLADEGSDLMLGEGSEITLDDGGSGLSAEGRSGIAMDFDDPTIPDFGEVEAEQDGERTDHDLPVMQAAGDDGEPTFDLALDSQMGADGKSGVIMFEDEAASDYSETVVHKGGAGPREEPEEETFDLAADDFDDFDDELSDSEEIDEFDDEYDDDELEVAADIEGEDDELDDLEGFDEDYDDEYDEDDELAPAASGVPAPVEADWGAMTFVSLIFTFVVLCFGGAVVYDLVRTMWVVGGPTTTDTPLLEKLAEIFVG